MTILDFLYTVLTAAIIILTVFISIALYHLIVILKRIHTLCDLIEDKTERFLNAFHDLAGKLCGLKATVDMFGGMLKSIVSQVAEKKARHTMRKNSRRDSGNDSK